MPATGKSTAAQFLLRQLARQRVPARWWYEELQGHPLAPFDDQESLRRVLDDLFSGRHAAVVEAVLARWQALATGLLPAGQVGILDGSLFGHLTWTLLPAGVPPEEIAAYVRRAEALVQPLEPCLVYLRDSDVAGLLRRSVARRGERWGERMLRRTLDSPFARRRGLAGFDGWVTYWSAYQALADDLFARSTLRTLRLDDLWTDWAAAYRQLTAFLGLRPPLPEPEVDPHLAQRLAGRYAAGEDPAGACEVRYEDGRLLVDGLRHTWRQSRLIPLDTPEITEPPNTLSFAVESYPLLLRFELDPEGAVVALHAGGDRLLGGPIAPTYRRRS